MRGLVGELALLARTYSDRVDVVTVYITEAHATDEWPIGSVLQYEQPRTLAQRRHVARDFISHTGYELPVLLDGVGVEACAGNAFELIYVPWPIRFYIIHKSRLAHIAKPSQCAFSLNDIRRQLDLLVS